MEPQLRQNMSFLLPVCCRNVSLCFGESLVYACSDKNSVLLHGPLVIMATWLLQLSPRLLPPEGTFCTVRPIIKPYSTANSTSLLPSTKTRLHRVVFQHLSKLRL